MQPDAIILLLRLGFLALIYLFLLALLLILWRDVAAPHAPREQRSLAAMLSVVDPGASGRGPGEILALERMTSLGRDPASAVVLADPSVSAEHALLSFQQGHWWLHDLDSTNGTFINGIRIEQPTIVRPGDTIRLGVVSLRLQA